MKQLKGVILSLRDVVAKSGKNDPQMLEEVVKLLQYLKSKEIEPVFISNGTWNYSKRGEKVPLVEHFSERAGFEMQHYIGGQNGMPMKQFAGSLESIKEDYGLTLIHI